jgi:hypothetical protein
MTEKIGVWCAMSARRGIMMEKIGVWCAMSERRGIMT